LSRVLLLRHAKAGWARPGMSDRDRPLDDTGRRDARAIGAAMRRHGYQPALIFCSPAVRARETLDGVAMALDTRHAVYSEALFAGDATSYLAVIRSAGAAESVLLVGHNPMMEDIATALAANGDADALHVLAGGFPTAGLAAIRMDGALSDAAPGRGYLEAFLTPSDA
jgi:phosphohistidine phosphatase